MAGVSNARWFRAIGTAFTSSARQAADVLAGQVASLTPVTVLRVHDASSASRALAAIDAEGSWWDVEESARTTLWQAAADRLGEGELAMRLTERNEAFVASLESIPLPPPLDRDRPLAAAAREALLLAAHQMDLVDAAEASGHWLEAKYTLFQGGYWLLGSHRSALIVY